MKLGLTSTIRRIEPSYIAKLKETRFERLLHFQILQKDAQYQFCYMSPPYEIRRNIGHKMLQYFEKMSVVNCMFVLNS